MYKGIFLFKMGELGFKEIVLKARSDRKTHLDE